MMLGIFSRRKGEGAPDRRRFVAVGYPKVGNTWLRFTLGRYLQLAHGLEEMPLLDPAEFPVLASYTPAVGEFTHAPLEWEKQTVRDLTIENVVTPFAHLKVILLVRHPLDALVSNFHYERNVNTANPYRGTLQDFIADPVFGLAKLLHFYALWHDGRMQPREFLLWRYEAARAAPARALEEVLRFVGERLDTAIVEQAVFYASFDNMRAIEASGHIPAFKSSGFPIFGAGDRSNPEAFHVRKGIVGGWRRYLSADVAERFEAEINAQLPEFYGYGTAPHHGACAGARA